MAAPQAYFEFARTITPDRNRNEPGVWFQELRLLQTLSLDAEIRRISLKRGLNIVWSPPEDPQANTGLYREGWGGHAAGKTLFCRILRYLLDEPNFATKALTESIQGEFLELWAIARVRVAGEAWVIGRPLTGPGREFATRADRFEDALRDSVPLGGYDAFRAKLESLVGEPLRDLYPDHAWRHTLPWLARDQESRYARITAWRDTLSEADRPQTSVARQYGLMRALLGLLDPKEHRVQSDLDVLAEDQRKLEPRIERHAALEERDRRVLVASILRVLPEGLSLDDLQAAQTRLTSHREIRVDRLQQIQSVPEIPELRTAREGFEAARDELVREKAAVGYQQSRATTLRAQANEMMASVERIRVAGISDPKRTTNGWCPHTVEFARAKGCVEGEQRVDQPTALALSELESKATRFFAEADQAITEQGRSESRLEQLEAVAVERTNRYAALSAATQVEAVRLQREITQLEDSERRLEVYTQTATELGDLRKLYAKNSDEIDRGRDKARKLRESMDTDRQQFVAIFADIIRAVVGASVEADVKIDGDGVHLHATRQGELSGAALETVKTLSFDIAGIVASIEGRCVHPRFLIHDGPREADMDRVIYEHFFTYVVDRMEAAFEKPERASFQYILTTTTPPPENMQEGSAWLVAKLSSHSKGERLLKANL